MSLELQKARFIPYSRNDIVRLLLDEEKLNKSDRKKLKDIGDLLMHVYHFEFHQSLETLKECYAPVNPDADTYTVFSTDKDELAEKESCLFDALNGLLDKANFEKITSEDLERSMAESSLFQIKLNVDFDDFEQVLFFRRGESKRQETLVSMLGLRKKEVEFINYDRVVVIVKFRPQSYFDAKERGQLYFKPGSTIIKYFRNIPRCDLEMLFPNTEVRMKPIDKVIIAVPAAVGGAIMLATKLGTTLLLSGALIAFWLGMRNEPVELNQANLLALAVGFGTLGAFLWKQFSNFKNRKIRFMKTLADNLYFKNLDNNMGVFHRLIDAAEEEECKEAMLAYYFLLIADKPLSAEELDQQVEDWFQTSLQHALDFEVDDALQKLLKLGLVSSTSNKYKAVSLNQARTLLDQQWDNYFTF
ncbi:MAG: TMEM143 family protein [Methylophilaceae bacterium]